MTETAAMKYERLLRGFYKLSDDETITLVDEMSYLFNCLKKRDQERLRGLMEELYLERIGE